MKIIYEPKIEHLKDIEAWLKEEEEDSGQGFFCNWSILEDSYKTGRFIVLEIESQVAGFITWTNYKKYIGIDIVEINPIFRNQGIGTYFYIKLEEYFKLQGFIALKLFCEPIESEKFWKKMGFIKFPSRGYSEPELTYYKPLCEVCKTTEIDTEDKLELWDVEPYQTKNNPPKWTWTVVENIPPILQPVNGDWNLRLTRNGKVIKEDKVKYFGGTKEILIGPFLFLEQLDK